MDLEKIKKGLPGMEKNVSLAEHTSFKIGGPARFFYAAEKEKEVKKALKWAKERELSVFILGGGSNLLVSDSGFGGLVLKMANQGIIREGTRVIVEAGTKLSAVVDFYTQNSLSGMSWAAGIPEATVGGAVRGNAASFGGSTGESVLWVRAFDPREEKVTRFEREECDFGNKESVFKTEPFVILGAGFESEPGEKSALEKEVRERIEYRRKHHPMGLASAGCIFKNLVADRKTKKPAVVKKYPLLEKFNKQGRIPAGYLIDKAGLKGKKKGGARISQKHANFIVNTGEARARDVVFLADLCKKKVKRIFGVELEEEIKYVGFEER